jgi:hypothetical protein
MNASDKINFKPDPLKEVLQGMRKNQNVMKTKIKKIEKN